MARLNIETRIVSDPRFQNLLIAVGDRHKAKGMLWDLWELAQRFWFPERKPISREAWETAELTEALVDCGFVEHRDDGYYAKGSAEQFEWLFECREAGRRGGNKRAQNASEAAENEDQGNPKGTLADPKGSQASLLSSLSSKELNTIMLKKPKISAVELEHAYRDFPRKQGKSAGMKIAEREIRTPDDLALLRQAITRFRDFHIREKTDPKFIPYFKTFMSHWREWLDPETGTGMSKDELAFQAYKNAPVYG
jgi:hypothetical protein